MKSVGFFLHIFFTTYVCYITRTRGCLKSNQYRLHDSGSRKKTCILSGRVHYKDPPELLADMAILCKFNFYMNEYKCF